MPNPATTQKSTRELFWWTLALTVAIETITCILRFGLGLESTRDTASTIGRLTFGLRIHHGYVGLFLLPIAYGLRNRAPATAQVLFVVGGALVASDLIHHFLILYPITGSPHFHLWYDDRITG